MLTFLKVLHKKKTSYRYSPKKNTSVLEMQIMGSKPVPSQSIHTHCGNPYLQTDLSHNRWLIYTLGGSIYPVHGWSIAMNPNSVEQQRDVSCEREKERESECSWGVLTGRGGHSLNWVKICFQDIQTDFMRKKHVCADSYKNTWLGESNNHQLQH